MPSNKEPQISNNMEEINNMENQQINKTKEEYLSLMRIATVMIILRNSLC